MGKVILDQESLGLSALFERMTTAKVLDCFGDKESLYFVVARGDLGKALGKGAINLKRAQYEFGRRVKLVEYQENLVDFVKSVVYPLTVQEIIVGEGLVTLKDVNKKTKSLLIGREGRNLNLIKRAVKRFFNVDVKIG